MKFNIQLLQKFMLPVALVVFPFCTTLAQQHGLENIIVEKYYVSDAADAAASKGGKLPVGSVTYRVFVDMLPGYFFQAAYGVPGHFLRIATTTTFFNNEEYGASIANDIPKSKLGENSVMLDSWISVGAGSAANFGIPKTDDNGKGTMVNADHLLKNADPSAGIPLTVQDGLLAASPVPAANFFGIDSVKLLMFGNTNSTAKGQVFTTDNGSWACMGGAAGPNAENKVLIGQFTTDGDFSFALNIQIGTPAGTVENYVAEKPMEAEIRLPCMTYFSKSMVHSMKLKN